MQCPTEQRACVADADLERHKALVRRTARSFHRRLPRHALLEDLAAECWVSLWSSLLKYDPANPSGMTFEAFARSRMVRAMVDELRAADPAPRGRRALQRRIHAAQDRAEHDLGRSAEPSEIAAAADLSPSAYRALLADLARFVAISLDEPAAILDWRDRGPTVGHGIADVGARPDEALLAAEASGCVRAAICGLPRQQRAVVALRYYAGWPSRFIGDFLGVSESRVSQVHTAALGGLRTALGARPDGAAA